MEPTYPNQPDLITRKPTEKQKPIFTLTEASRLEQQNIVYLFGRIQEFELFIRNNPNEVNRLLSLYTPQYTSPVAERKELHERNYRIRRGFVEFDVESNPSRSISSKTPLNEFSSTIVRCTHILGACAFSIGMWSKQADFIEQAESGLQSVALRSREIRYGDYQYAISVGHFHNQDTGAAAQCRLVSCSDLDGTPRTELFYMPEPNGLLPRTVLGYYYPSQTSYVITFVEDRNNEVNLQELLALKSAFADSVAKIDSATQNTA